MKNSETMSFKIDYLKAQNETNGFGIIEGKKIYDADDMMLEVYDAFLDANHQNPVGNIVEYFLSDEPIYITRNRNARSLISSFDRYELLIHILESYLKSLKKNKKR